MNAPKLKVTKSARVGIAAVTLTTIKGLLAQVPDHATMLVSVPAQTPWDGDSLPVTTFQFTWEDIEEEPRPSGQDLPDGRHRMVARAVKAMEEAGMSSPWIEDYASAAVDAVLAEISTSAEVLP